MLKVFSRKIPLGKETPITIFRKLSPKKGFILYSANSMEENGRYSFIGGNPFLEFKSKGKTFWKNGKKSNGKPFNELKKLVKKFRIEKPKNLPAFYGGAIGYFSYDFGKNFEKLPSKSFDVLKFPECHFIFADSVYAIDNLKKKIHAICLASGEKTAFRKLEEMENVLAGKASKAKPVFCVKKLESNFSKKDYLKAIEKIRDYIKAGDTFQVNLSQRFETELNGKPLDLFEKLMQFNPGNFCAFIDFGIEKIVSSAPERLVKVENGFCEARPIAGTRPRGKTATEDFALEKELLSSEKEMAEHAMLVDLARNDLGKVCDYGTVKVSEKMIVEKYAKVMHLVSKVVGKLHEKKDCFGAFRAMFPGGTITGCPKIRTIEIINELEPAARGIYTGSIGYFNFSGDCDFNIAIRTIALNGKKAFIQVGGGIVFDSIPEKEFNETLYKGEALFNAINGKIDEKK